MKKEQLESMIREEIAAAFAEGEVIDFRQRKMLDIQKKMMGEPEPVFIVNIDPWGQLEAKRFDVAFDFAKTSIANGFKLQKGTSKEIFDALDNEEPAEEIEEVFGTGYGSYPKRDPEDEDDQST